MVNKKELLASNMTIQSYVDPIYVVASGLSMILGRVPILNRIVNALFSIKGKLIGTTLAIVLLVIVTLSAVLLRIQYQALIEKTDETGRATAVGLSSIAIEGITQNKRSIINDYVNNLRSSRIRGLSSVFVVEYKYARSSAEKHIANGVFIAHLDAKSINTAVPAAMFHELVGINGLHRDTIVEHGERIYRYTFPVEWKVKLKGQERIAALGVTQLRFVEKDVLAVFYRARSAVFLTSLIVIGIAAVRMYLIGMLIVRPILILANGVTRVKDGDLTTHLDIQSNDEIGRLSENFNEMTTHLREKLAMQKFVSASTVQMIRDSAGSSHAEIERKGERKTVVVFFSDIRGFTAYSEHRQPEEVVEMLNYYLDLQTKIILKYGGDVDKYVGDEVMAIFQGDLMAVNALNASIDIQRAMDVEMKKKKELRTAAIAVGIGLNLGDVVMGSMGAKNRMDFTVIGDTVNLGARLCAAAGKGEIIVTEVIRSHAGIGGHGLQFHKVAPVVVKGKTEPVPIYKVW